MQIEEYASLEMKRSPERFVRHSCRELQDANCLEGLQWTYTRAEASFMPWSVAIPWTDFLPTDYLFLTVAVALKSVTMRKLSRNDSKCPKWICLHLGVSKMGII